MALRMIKEAGRWRCQGSGGQILHDADKGERYTCGNNFCEDRGTRWADLSGMALSRKGVAAPQKRQAQDTPLCERA